MSLRSFLKSASLCVAVSTSAIAAAAQGTEIGFGNSEHDGNAPVEVTADQLDMQRDAGRAKFTGNVAVSQGEMRLFGDVVDVEYAENAEGETVIQRVHATGNVTLFNGAEAAEGEDAVYTVESGVVVMTGDVLVTQGDNTMAGEKLTVNLDTGIGQMEGRVKVFFNPESEPETTQ
ncbi:LptA/OstA family protein [Tropicimonas sp. IMCC6043]|uniref:LptA/OstA family protein n=1 Tax=Tropicimonas sp. IMCC6043 TaxID=2510645 RepID=UPI0026CE093E